MNFCPAYTTSAGIPGCRVPAVAGEYLSVAAQTPADLTTISAAEWLLHLLRPHESASVAWFARCIQRQAKIASALGAFRDRPVADGTYESGDDDVVTVPHA